MTNVLKRCVTVLAFSFILITMGATHLKASDLDTLNYTNGFTTCPIGGCASVDLLINSSTSATITVTSLLNGYQFDNFGFNSTGGSITLASASGAIDTTDPKYGLSGPGSYALSGFGKFMYVFDTGINGGSTGSACVSGGAGCKFTINLTGTGLTETAFDKLSTGGAGDGTAQFAGHIAGSVCTGFTGGGDVTGESNTNGTSSCGSTSTPEPRTLTLLGSGLLGLLILGFRRRAFSSSFSAV